MGARASLLLLVGLGLVLLTTGAFARQFPQDEELNRGSRQLLQRAQINPAASSSSAGASAGGGLDISSILGGKGGSSSSSSAKPKRTHRPRRTQKGSKSSSTSGSATGGKSGLASVLGGSGGAKPKASTPAKGPSTKAGSSKSSSSSANITPKGANIVGSVSTKASGSTTSKGSSKSATPKPKTDATTAQAKAYLRNSIKTVFITYSGDGTKPSKPVMNLIKGIIKQCGGQLDDKVNGGADAPGTDLANAQKCVTQTVCGYSTGFTDICKKSKLI